MFNGDRFQLAEENYRTELERDLSAYLSNIIIVKREDIFVSFFKWIFAVVWLLQYALGNLVFVTIECDEDFRICASRCNVTRLNCHHVGYT